MAGEKGTLLTGALRSLTSWIDQQGATATGRGPGPPKGGGAGGGDHRPPVPAGQRGLELVAWAMSHRPVAISRADRKNTGPWAGAVVRVSLQGPASGSDGQSKPAGRGFWAPDPEGQASVIARAP